MLCTGLEKENKYLNEVVFHAVFVLFLFLGKGKACKCSMLLLLTFRLRLSTLRYYYIDQQ